MENTQKLIDPPWKLPHRPLKKVSLFLLKWRGGGYTVDTAIPIRSLYDILTYMNGSFLWYMEVNIQSSPGSYVLVTKGHKSFSWSSSKILLPWSKPCNLVIRAKKGRKCDLNWSCTRMSFFVLKKHERSSNQTCFFLAKHLLNNYFV